MLSGQQGLVKIKVLFWVVALAHFTASALSLTVMLAITKSLLMPLLVVMLVKGSSLKINNNRLLLMALLFSWAGDVLLLFTYKNELFFIAGLLSFLCAHIMYIFYFSHIKGPQPSLLKHRPWLVVAALLYVAAFVFLLYPNLGALRLPVLVYACVIITMLLYSLHAYRQLPKQTANTFVVGAVFFVLSDSLLAINKFYAPFPLAGVAIMLTYCLAQYCIISGGISRTNIAP
jgi:uncharacterized membrane protein YhhN